MGVLRERFYKEVATSDNTVFDRFLGPPSRLSWAQDVDAFGYGSLNHFNVAGASLFAKIGLDSLRTAAIEALPVDLWQDHWLGWLGDFINGTIGNPQEERIQLTSISYSAVRTSWENTGKNSGFQWGFRPWSRSPYLYLLAQAGHFESRPLFTFESRAGYTIFGTTRMESRLALQLPASFQIAASGSICPTRMNATDSSAGHVGVTLERILGSRFNPNSVFYVGFRAGMQSNSPNPRHENMFVLGFSKLW